MYHLHQVKDVRVASDHFCLTRNGIVAMQRVRPLPAMPAIGQPESVYARQIQLADKTGDLHLHEASKVGQYVTLALAPTLPWPKKLKYFDHALRRHCVPPPLPDDDVWLFYRQLSDLVRTHAGEQALRMACAQDDNFARRVAAGESKRSIQIEARQFFYELMTLNEEKPAHFNDEDWMQLKLIREQWV
jgi:hypothetical protein